MAGPAFQAKLAVRRPGKWFYGLTLSEQRGERELHGKVHLSVQAILLRTENSAVCNWKTTIDVGEVGWLYDGEPCVTLVSKIKVLCLKIYMLM